MIGRAVSKFLTPQGDRIYYTVLALAGDGPGRRVRLRYAGRLTSTGAYVADAAGALAHEPVWLSASRFYVHLHSRKVVA